FLALGHCPGISTLLTFAFLSGLLGAFPSCILRLLSDRQPHLLMRQPHEKPDTSHTSPEKQEFQGNEMSWCLVDLLHFCLHTSRANGLCSDQERVDTDQHCALIRFGVMRPLVLDQPVDGLRAGVAHYCRLIWSDHRYVRSTPRAPGSQRLSPDP